MHQQHGLFGAIIIEPAGSTYHDVKTGEPIKSGTQAIIKAPGMPDFREFVLAVHDFALLFDKDGNPLNPPNVPGSPDDPGVMGVNYKCEPLMFRKGDPAYVFSSYVHGDPVTPLLETYAGDPVRIRLFDGAHEEQHSFIMSGLRWHTDPANLLSPLACQQTIGISEAFNLHLDTNYKPGDYLYYFGGEDDLWLGLWGIFRAHEKAVPHLAQLDDRPALSAQSMQLPIKTGRIPEKAKLPDLPEGMVVRKVEISAIQKDIVYNKYGDHDPNGLLFVYTDQADEVISGKLEPEPLIIRANAGDLIEVTLTNRFTRPPVQTFHPGVPVNAVFPPSSRVSIQPGLVLYDPKNSGGVTVGFNPDQTAGPGESVTIRWYADRELGTCMLFDMADIMNHRGHGLWGALIIEPKGAVYLDSETYLPLPGDVNAQSAVIKTDKTVFREFVLFMQDGIGLYDKDGNLIPDAIETAHGGGHSDDEEDGVDFEDQGQKGFNYRSERFDNRFEKNSDPLYVFSSKVHGDPSTPVFEAYTGEDITIRLLMPADKPRNHGFVLHGHKWQSQPDNPLSGTVWSQGAISVGGAYNIQFLANSYEGDYLYRSGSFRWSVEQGMWGIVRIKNIPLESPVVTIIKIIVIIMLAIVILWLLKRTLIRILKK